MKPRIILPILRCLLVTGLLVTGSSAAYAETPPLETKLPSRSQLAPKRDRFERTQATQGGARASLAASANLLLEQDPKLPAYWGRSALEGFKAAVAEHKLLVVLFVSDWCEWCKKTDEYLNRSTELDALKDCALFVRVNPEKDQSAKHIYDSLGIKNYPAVSVLMPNPNLIEEAGRIVGLPEGEGLAVDLKLIFREAAKRDAEVSSCSPQ